MRSSLILLLIILFTLSSFAQKGKTEKNFITHGPVLGRLSSDGIGIWARTSMPGEFSIKYGESKENLNMTTRLVKTELKNDNTAWHHLKGLKSNTKYFYKLVIPGIQERTGRSGEFITLPNKNDYVENETNPEGLFNFSFEFACGNNQTPNQGLGPSLPTYETMYNKLKDKIHFAILNGDWLYESRRAYNTDQWLGQVNQSNDALPEILKLAPTLTGVWENYKFYYDQSFNLSRWHRYIPTYYTYDDHETLNDIWGAGEIGLRDRRAVFRDIGVKGWYDYLAWSNPVEFDQDIHFGKAEMEKGSNILLDESAKFTELDLAQTINLHVHWGTETAGVNDNSLDGVGGMENAGVYKIVKVIDDNKLEIEPKAKADEEVNYSIGKRSYYKFTVSNCDFFVLDTRGHREMHDIREPNKKGLTMLGEKQLNWLLDGTKNSEADFIFVVSSVNFTVPHVGGAGIRTGNKEEAWTVFLEEREKVIAHFDNLDKKIFVLTGDLHNSFAVKITDNLWEFGSGPHNSMNHWATDEGDRPANGKFKYAGREVDIRWSSHYRSDTPRSNLLFPTYCVVQLNNVYTNPIEKGTDRWIAYPKPHVIFQYYDGITGDLKYAESILAN